MRKITPQLTSELFKHFGNPQQTKVAASDAYKIATFRELVENTAKLAFKNKDHLLFFRGQTQDYRNKAGVSTFYPSIYRGEYLSQKEIDLRFAKLKQAGKLLVQLFEDKKIEGCREVSKRKSIQWSILQHYEVCPTPYMDFTHSLRVACSFATIDNNNASAYIYIFGLPYFTNRISMNSEHDIINIRLLSICPPTALRPYFQEGYLVGTDGITSNYDSKGELDFNNRLVAKFEIPNNNSFWGDDFHQIPKNSLYPENDPIEKVCDLIKILFNKY